MSYRVGIILAVLAVSPAAAGRIALPRGLVGVWAPQSEECRDQDGVTHDGRVEVTPHSVGFFASLWEVRRWERSGSAFRGQAQIAEEGEDKPAHGYHLIAVRLLPDARLQIRRGREAPEVFVKCPAGVKVR